MSEPWDDEDRAIARALDAASDSETHRADEQLVDAYRDVLAQMPVTEVTPRPELEDRVVAAALARRPAAIRALDGRRAPRAARVRWAALGVAAVAAAFVIGLIVRSATSPAPAPGGHVTLATSQRPDLGPLLRRPGTRIGDFGGGAGRVAIGSDGNAFVYDLARTDSVSIALVGAHATTVIGPAEPADRAIAFVVDHPDRVRAVALQRNGVEIAHVELSSR